MLIYSRDANNLNNFIAKLRAFTERWQKKIASYKHHKSLSRFWCMLYIWGSKLNPQQGKAVAEFLSGSDVFVNLPAGYGKKAAQPFSKRKHSRMQNLPEKSLKTCSSSLVKIIILLLICPASTLNTLELNTSINDDVCRVSQRPFACMNDPD